MSSLWALYDVDLTERLDRLRSLAEGMDRTRTCVAT